MHRILFALLVGATLLAVPTTSADVCDGDPSALVEVCTDPGQTGDTANAPDVNTSGCLVDVNGNCVPSSASVGEGTAIGTWRAMTYEVGVDANVACPFISKCSASYDTAVVTYNVVEAVI